VQVRFADDTMGGAGDKEALDVVGRDVVAAINDSRGLARLCESLGAAGRNSKMQSFVGAGGLDEVQDVFDDGVIEAGVQNTVLEGDDLLAGHDGFEIVQALASGLGGDDSMLLAALGIAECDAEQEAVELIFGEVIGSLKFEWVLRGDEHEGPLEDERLVIDADLFLAHGFKQRGLSARGGTIDFVGQDDVGEDGSGFEIESLPLGVEDRDAQDVAGEKVGGELDSAEFAVDTFGQRAGEDGFSDTGDVFDEDVAACQKAGEQKIDGSNLSQENGLDIFTKRFDCLLGHCSTREKTIRPSRAAVRKPTTSQCRFYQRDGGCTCAE
jgi:hypothetical protein